jgi:hypothetical protein
MPHSWHRGFGWVPRPLFENAHLGVRWLYVNAASSVNKWIPLVHSLIGKNSAMHSLHSLYITAGLTSMPHSLQAVA